RPVAEVPAERERSHRARQGVGGDREPDEEAELAGRGRPHGKPRDRDDAHAVAEGGDAEARQQPPGARVSEQRAIGVRDQFTACFTSAAIRFSSAAVSFVSAKAIGHMEPSSRFAVSLKPNIAYRSLNFPASRKKQTTLPSFA